MKYSIEEVKSIFKKYNCELITNEYKDNKQFLDIIASCGHHHTCKLNVFLSAKNKTCKKCAKKISSGKLKIPFKKVKNEFTSRSCNLLTNTYDGQHQQLEYIAECGHKSTISFKNFVKRKFNMCTKCSKTGEKNSVYKKDKTDEERFNDRSSEDYRFFRNNVFNRDNYTCISCGDNKGGNLECHHKDSHNWCKEKRLEENNGATLCKECHKTFHYKYGFGDNTKEQFNEWLEIARLEK